MSFLLCGPFLLYPSSVSHIVAPHVARAPGLLLTPFLALQPRGVDSWKKLSKTGCSALFKTGVGLKPEIGFGGKLMLGTGLVRRQGQGGCPGLARVARAAHAFP